MTEEEKKRIEEQDANIKKALEECRAAGVGEPGALSIGPDATPDERKKYEERLQKFKNYINAILVRKPTEEEMKEFREEARKIPDKLVGEDDD